VHVKIRLNSELGSKKKEDRRVGRGTGNVESTKFLIQLNKSQQFLNKSQQFFSFSLLNYCVHIRHRYLVLVNKTVQKTKQISF
jgi:hypothetical protein